MRTLPINAVEVFLCHRYMYKGLSKSGERQRVQATPKLAIVKSSFGGALAEYFIKVYSFPLYSGAFGMSRLCGLRRGLAVMASYSN